jgi:hypothetical protein
VRDYIHVVDLVLGHVAALERLAANPGVVTYNLGTGRGNSVLEVIAAFERAAGKSIPYRIVDRRPGDVAASYADPGLASQELGWEASYTLDDMCADAWRWQSNNPYGYGEGARLMTNEKLSLVVLAAGIGSRYGGLKQMDPMGPGAEIILDYSVYDALRAGFDRVVFVISRAIEEMFRERIGRTIEKQCEVAYAFQSVR